MIAALQVAHPRVQWMFAETRALAEDWAYRWLAAAAAAERAPSPERAAPALGEPAIQYELPYRMPMLDASARRERIAREARAGTAWTVRLVAGRLGVHENTAREDLRALVAAGALVAGGASRRRVYKTAGPEG